jgi:hypothetical protein
LVFSGFLRVFFGPSRLLLLLRCLLLPFIEGGEMTNEGGGGLYMRDSPRSPQPQGENKWIKI